MGSATLDYFDSYNERVNAFADNELASNADYYNTRLATLDKVFQEFNLGKPAIQDFNLPEGLADDEESEVIIPDQADDPNNYAKNEAFIRSEVVDPAEARLFLSTTRESRNQQNLWSEFSQVEPGNSLGSMGFNTLRQHNLRSDLKRFTKTKKNTVHASRVPTIAEMERRAPKATQPTFIPVVQNEFGNVQFEDDTPVADYQLRSQMTNERLHTDKNREWDRPSIYHPELRLSSYKPKPTRIPELRNNGYDFGLPNVRPSQQQAVLGSDAKTGYHFTPLIRNDQYGMKQRKANPTSYNEKLISSSRF